MPGSRIIGKAEIKSWIDKQSDIKVIVDVGCGSGTYAKLLGDKYEYIGIEIWEPYIEMFNLRALYKEVVINDIRFYDFPKGDCVIFGDVLEHLDKRDALGVLERADRLYRHIIVSIPVSENGEVASSEIHYGNPNEEHRSGWTYEELCKMYRWEKTINSRGLAVFMK